jgi:hypothetical protein
MIDLDWVSSPTSVFPSRLGINHLSRSILT